MKIIKSRGRMRQRWIGYSEHFVKVRFSTGLKSGLSPSSRPSRDFTVAWVVSWWSWFVVLSSKTTAPHCVGSWLRGDGGNISFYHHHQTSPSGAYWSVGGDLWCFFTWLLPYRGPFEYYDTIPTRWGFVCAAAEQLVAVAFNAWSFNSNSAGRTQSSIRLQY